MVFIDESGSNLGMARQHARSEKGTRAHSRKPMDRGENITMLGALMITGIVGFCTIKAATTTEVFLMFILKVVLPKLRPGNVVIMDNLKSHINEQIREAIEGVGARVVFLPPYSPELNPIEECWSKIKSILRRCAARTKRTYNKAIKQAIDAVTKEDAIGWFCHAGYLSECN
jgi:transposase